MMNKINAGVRLLPAKRSVPQSILHRFIVDWLLHRLFDSISLKFDAIYMTTMGGGMMKCASTTVIGHVDSIYVNGMSTQYKKNHRAAMKKHRQASQSCSFTGCVSRFLFPEDRSRKFRCG